MLDTFESKLVYDYDYDECTKLADLVYGKVYNLSLSPYGKSPRTYRVEVRDCMGNFIIEIELYPYDLNNYFSQENDIDKDDDVYEEYKRNKLFDNRLLIMSIYKNN